MSPDAKKIAHLAEITQKLNAETDALNKDIESLEAQLQASGAGVTVWIDYIFEEEGPYEQMDSRDEEVEFRYTEGTQLGYAKTGGKWRICVRDVRQNATPENVGYGDFYSLLWTGQPRPLVEASRNLRAQAAGFLDKLVDLIIKEAQSHLNTVSIAREMAKK